jgi:hypothetical protein
LKVTFFVDEEQRGRRRKRRREKRKGRERRKRGFILCTSFGAPHPKKCPTYGMNLREVYDSVYQLVVISFCETGCNHVSEGV